MPFHIPPLSQNITCLARDNNNPFRLAYCTSKRTVILDTRLPQKPIFEFEYHDHKNPPNGAEFKYIHGKGTISI